MSEYDIFDNIMAAISLPDLICRGPAGPAAAGGLVLCLVALSVLTKTKLPGNVREVSGYPKESC